MRILGVTQKWGKLKQPRWTTFRLRRRDRDWGVGEVVQVVYKTRSKQRQALGIARITKIELRRFLLTTSREGSLIIALEATEDGFTGVVAMERWMVEAHGDRIRKEPINKLILRWIERYD